MALKYSVVTGGVEHLDDKKEIVVFMGVFGGVSGVCSTKKRIYPLFKSVAYDLLIGRVIFANRIRPLFCR
jgi:hypothetical protein